MRMGRLKILWTRKDPLGRPMHPWEEITLDQLSPEARKLIQKMARVCARDYFEERREEFLEEMRRTANLIIEEEDGMGRGCSLCGGPLGGQKARILRGAWYHEDVRHCAKNTDTPEDSVCES